MPKKQFKIPKAWALSPQQELVIGSLLDDAGRFVSPAELSAALYPDDPIDDGMSAPAKLRVLVQRCRQLLDDHTGGIVPSVSRRNSGWKITKITRLKLGKFLEQNGE